MVDMAGNSARFNTTGSDELVRMALGYELKGLLLNYALASRQKAELAIAKDKEALVEKNLVALEEDVKAAKEKCEGDLKTLREKNAEEIANLTKKHEEELANAKRDKESAIKTMNVVQGSVNAKDEQIKALTKDNEVALAELASLRQEKANWGSQKDNLEAAIGEQYEEGFRFALEQVKILFPGIDPDVLSKANAMMIIEGDKLVPHAPAGMVQDSPPKDSPTKEPSAQDSPAQE
jgi:flagellar biosynthesis GTPase FlhF